MHDQITIAELLTEAREQLRRTSFEVPGREASLLLGHLLGWSEAQVRARSDHPVGGAPASRFRRWIERRCQGEPVAYLLGEREFYGRPFRVDDRVLIPRPETEHIVEIALDLPLPAKARILDIGTGSGCLAVTLAAELPQAHVVATDLSPHALAVMAHNRRHLGVGDRVHGIATDLASGLKLESFDLVVSNPPYVAPAEMASMSPEVTGFEPHLALFAPDEGRRLIVRLLEMTGALRPEAHLLIEIGYDQGDWLEASVGAYPHLELLEIRRDLSGIARTAVLRRRS